MDTKDKKSGAEKKTAAQLSESLKESAQQIWLAGLGAFAKAQEEGGKVFDTLVKEGTTLQRKTQAAAEETVSEASSRMAGMASELSAKASGQWDKLEGIFEQRVAKAMSKMGAPSSEDLDALIARIDELDRKVASLSARAGTARRTPAKSARSAAARRPAARKPPE